MTSHPAGAPRRAALPARLPVRLLATGSLAFALLGIVPSLYGVALPSWTAAFGLGEGEAARILSAHGLGAFLAVAAGIAGLSLLTMRVGLGLLAAGAALMAGGWGWFPTLAGALVGGMGYGTVSVVVNRRVLIESGGRGPGMVGIVNAVFGLGAIAAPVLFLWAAGRPGPVLWGLAAGTALLALAAAPEPFGSRAPRGLPPLRDRRLLILLFNVAGIAIEVALPGLGASALLDLGLTEPDAARLTSAFFATFLLARLALWWLTRLIAADRLVLLALGGAGASAALASMGLPSLGFVLSGAFVGLFFPSFYVWGTQVLGGDARLGSAILTSGLLGATLGPILLEPILAHTGEAGVFPAMATLGLGAALAFAAVAARRRAAPA